MRCCLTFGKISGNTRQFEQCLSGPQKNKTSSIGIMTMYFLDISMQRTCCNRYFDDTIPDDVKELNSMIYFELSAPSKKYFFD